MSAFFVQNHSKHNSFIKIRASMNAEYLPFFCLSRGIFGVFLYLFGGESVTNEARARLQQRIDRVKKSLDMYYEAEIAIISGAQSYSVGSRSLTRANLSEIRAAIQEYENLLTNLENQLNGRGRNLMLRAVPRDH